MPALVRIVLLNFLLSVEFNSPCRVYSGLGDPCIFPFKINGTFYAECTTHFGSGESMCPTRLAKEGSLEASGDAKDWGVCSKKCPLKYYRTNQQLYDQIIDLATKYSSIAKPFIIGGSANGQPLIGIRVSSKVNQERELLKPMVKFVANMQGNQASGREILMNLASHLIMGYGQDERLTALVDTTDISLLPSLNPDGFEKASEGDCSGSGKNNNGVDLDNDFPSWKDFQKFEDDLSYDPFSGGRQPETLALMNWSTQPFVISADLQDGGVALTYPFDHFIDGIKDSAENQTPDEDIFKHLASVYTTHNPAMANSSKCYRKAKADGFENGASWNFRNSQAGKSGSMKDFSYMFTNNLELSVKISCCKFPESYFLVDEWEKNKESLLSFIEEVHVGLKGLVSLEGNSLHQGAEILVWNPDGSKRGKNVLTSEFGEYWRLLRPGPPGNNTYTVQARFEDCQPGGSGRVYESLKHRVIISEKNPLKVQDLRMRSVGFCGVDEISNTIDVLADLERFAEEDRLKIEDAS